MSNDILKLVRPHIHELKAYTSARSEFSGTASVYIDANENPFDHDYNRYPDPYQSVLKNELVGFLGVKAENIFLSNGSDEAIDLIMRVFAEPEKDEMISFVPGFSMYKVAARFNKVALTEVRLDDDYDIDIEAYEEASRDANTKITWITTPNNPTGNSLSLDRIIAILEKRQGIIVVDEAYIDFSDQPSLISQLHKYERLVILRTFSKAFGAAGIRLGMTIASPEIISVLNKVKMPYNISELTQNSALEILRMGKWKTEVQQLMAQKAEVASKLSKYPFVNKVYPSDANFLLVRFDEAQEIYGYLLQQSIVVRDRSQVEGCEGCLRVTIGTPEENLKLIQALDNYNVS